MRRFHLHLCLATLLCSAHAACAQPHPGLALRWGRCFREGGASLRSFACNTNAGFEQLIGSFAVPVDIVDVVGNEIIVQLTTGSYWPYRPPTVPVPEWWRFKNPGTCRQTAVSFSTVKDPELSGCEDWAFGQATGAIGAYTIDYWGPGTARFAMISAVPAAAAAIVTPNVEYFSFELRIRHDKTVGDGACGGCDVPLVLVLNSIKVVTTRPENDRTLAGPFDGSDSDVAYWRPQVVPTRKNTWGEVKALYR